MTKGYRRRQFFFQDSFQGKYILSYFLIAGLITVLFTVLFIYFTSDTLSITYGNQDLTLGRTPEVLMDMILSIHGILIFVCGLFIIYFTTRLTHRIAGPIYKISQTLDRMISGDLTQDIQLRKHDEYKEIAEKINRFNEVMHARISDIESVSRALDDLVRRIEPDPEQTVSAEPDPLVIINDRLKFSVSFFNLPGNDRRDGSST
jgi:methyl-accepting chemotaxis protein